VTRLVELESTRTLNGKTSMERRHYISNATDKTAKELGDLIRRHWSVENNLHWVLDVAFREDDARHRAENCASNMATLRHFSVNLLKRDKTKKVGIANKRKLCGFSPDYLGPVRKGRTEDRGAPRVSSARREGLGIAELFRVARNAANGPAPPASRREGFSDRAYLMQVIRCV
jgi:predicted transposase YbfD/YdcC